MQRIQHATAAPELPAYVDNGADPGYFRDENLGLGQEGTAIQARFLNGLQEEIIGVIVEGGLTPDPADLGQMAAAILSMTSCAANFSSRVDTPTPSTDYTVSMTFDAPRPGKLVILGWLNTGNLAAPPIPAGTGPVGYGLAIKVGTDVVASENTAYPMVVPGVYTVAAAASLTISAVLSSNDAVSGHPPVRTGLLYVFLPNAV